MSKRKYDKPEFRFNVPTPEEMKQRIMEEEIRTGKPVERNFYERVMVQEKQRQYSLFKEQKHKDSILHKSIMKEFE